ncbi:MAG: hypothetical protein ACI9NT_002102 [Bacteroidia bacterium]|jgi:hypothetical protein
MSAHAHLRHEVFTCGVSNALFNGLAAWLLLRAGPALTWTGAQSFMVDVLATAFLLPLIVALIVIPMQRRKLRAGKLQAIDLGPESTLQRFANKLPTTTFTTALSFAVIGLCIIAPITLLGFRIFDVTVIEPMNYALFKGIWAGAIAAVLVVPMVLVALRAELV